MQDFFNTLGEFFSQLFMLISTGAQYLYVQISKWLTDVFSSMDIPLLPSRSKILYNTYISGSLLVLFLIYILFINIKTYSLFLEDKRAAIEDEYRISEARLLKYCFFGGALGGLFGMSNARHKTRKLIFTIGVRVMLCIQVLLFGIVCGFFGFWIYMS